MKRRKQVNFDLDEATLRQFKATLALKGTTMQDQLEQAVTQYLAAHTCVDAKNLVESLRQPA